MPGTAETPTDKPGLSPANRSLERGIALLRAFRPGSELLGNSELAERTGLPKATVSRLTQTLVGCGLLQWEATSRAYRLAPPVLSLAHAMRAGSRVLAVAAPHMRALAESRRINVGLAAPDGDEMVYLESIRYARRVALRHVVSGQRVPMELTSLGRAYLAVAPTVRRQAILRAVAQRRGDHWPALSREIEDAAQQVRTRGFCAASWQPEVVALAAPLPSADGAAYVLNVSLSTPLPVAVVAEELGDALRTLATRVAQDWAADGQRR
ncbi:IclR family transcriptional regulator [uncultured Pseudacidovorax sp.]|uniref:IclR family transcriptional regulator n=1 Tax=uncultured Pseudacidovorax sp. TaxID=679313 RepID=UPI0025E44CFD|nr:IclR family transcriptional regulator [uncultured Pseudacidovorax sp.]